MRIKGDQAGTAYVGAADQTRTFERFFAAIPTLRKVHGEPDAARRGTR